MIFVYVVFLNQSFFSFLSQVPKIRFVSIYLDLLMKIFGLLIFSYLTSSNKVAKKSPVVHLKKFFSLIDSSLFFLKKIKMDMVFFNLCFCKIFIKTILLKNTHIHLRIYYLFLNKNIKKKIFLQPGADSNISLI